MSKNQGLLVISIYFVLLSMVYGYYDDGIENEDLDEDFEISPLKSIKEIFSPLQRSDDLKKEINDLEPYFTKGKTGKDVFDIMNSELTKRTASVMGTARGKTGEAGTIGGYGNSLSNEIRMDGFRGNVDPNGKIKSSSLSITGSLEALQRKVAQEVADRQRNRNREFLSSIGKRNLDFHHRNENDIPLPKYSQFLYY